MKKKKKMNNDQFLSSFFLLCLVCFGLNCTQVTEGVEEDKWSV